MQVSLIALLQNGGLCQLNQEVCMTGVPTGSKFIQAAVYSKEAQKKVYGKVAFDVSLRSRKFHEGNPRSDFWKYSFVLTSHLLYQ